MIYDRIKSWAFPDVVQTYDRRDTLLYALGIGLGSDPLDPGQLRYTFEQPKLDAVPSMATILAYQGFWMQKPEAEVDWKRVVHAEQVITLHTPLPPAATVVGRNRVNAVVDKGPGKGVIIYQERAITDQATGTLLATSEESNFCRGDGGLDRSDEQPPPAGPEAPERAPDAAWDYPTLPQAALLYRLSGDWNPLHASPDIAQEVGFERPILHGLASFGVATHAVLRTYCDYDPAALKRIGLRFSSPVYPGETLRTELWREDGDVFFRTLALERDVAVLTRGHAKLR
jgi:acyl dehydratase